MITLPIIIEEITITKRTVIEMVIEIHDMFLRMTIYHLSSVILTIAQLGCEMIVLTVMDAALILKQKRMMVPNVHLSWCFVVLFLKLYHFIMFVKCPYHLTIAYQQLYVDLIVPLKTKVPFPVTLTAVLR